MKVCCIEGCTDLCETGRRYCKTHYLERRSELRKVKKAKGLKVRTMYPCICCNCKKAFEGFRKNSLFCSVECCNAFKASETNPYIFDSKNYKENLWEHRNIAERILNKKLNSNQVVHHLDCNPKNNAITNLIVLSRSEHTSLHQYLDRQRALLERSNNGNTENCWETLIVPITTTWLETANVKVIKIWEIGQSAAEPLLNEEGSETMHSASHVDEDIVQTTTSLDGI